MFKIEYYTENNKCPVFDFIKDQSPKDQAKILRAIDLLSEFGFSLGMPHIKKLQGTDSLWELRVKQRSDIFRIFYFSISSKRLVLLHGIRKNTNKTPPADIDIALKRLHKYIKGSDINES